MAVMYKTPQSLIHILIQLARVFGPWKEVAARINRHWLDGPCWNAA